MNCQRCGTPLPAPDEPCARCILGQEGDEPTFVAVKLSDVLEGKWKLLSKLGEGGMGSVYLAHDLTLDRQVAVKILSQNLVGDTEVVTRFEREARLTASLEHPNIVPVYAVGRHQNRPFMVMKKLEGETLADVIRRKGAFQPTEVTSLMRQLAAGLDFIHARGFVHRDIKAGNIIVGPDGHATILDFGILRPSRSKEALTRTGMVMGTPQYMSPEQAVGTRDVDHRADLYALAVVLFECLTGTLPFDADSELKIIQLQAYAPPPDLLERAPWIARGVAEVVKRALAKRPEDRFPSASELVAALGAAVAAPGAPPPPSSGAQTALSWRKRPNGATPAVAPASLALPPSGPDTAALAQALRPRRWPYLAIFVGLLLGGAAGGYAYLLSQAKAERARELEWMSEAALFDAGEPEPDAGTLAAVDEADEADAGEPSEDEGTFAELDLATWADAGELEVVVAAAVDAGVGKRVKPWVKKVRPKAGSGRLVVVTFSGKEALWADVTVNGESRGRTPLELDLPVGSHRVRVARTGFRTQEQKVRVTSGQARVLRVGLSP